MVKARLQTRILTLLIISIVVALVAISAIGIEANRVNAASVPALYNPMSLAKAPKINATLNITKVDNKTYDPVNTSVQYASPLTICGNVSVQDYISNLNLYNIKIDWGDGTSTSPDITAGIPINFDNTPQPDGSYFGSWQFPYQTGQTGHAYKAPGTYEVTIYFNHSQPGGADQTMQEFTIQNVYISQVATQMDFTEQPSDTAVNMPNLAAEVTIKDAGGDPVTLGNYRVSLTLGDQQGNVTTAATLSGSTTVYTGNTGTAIFSGLSIDKAGTYTLIANCDEAGLQATSALFEVHSFPLTVTGVTADNKTYDGTVTATINNTSASLNGLIEGYSDVYLDTAGASASFGNKNVGTNKPVSITGLSLDGPDATYYWLENSSVDITANISSESLTITAVTDSKIYNGNTGSNTVPEITDGKVAPGDAAAFTQTFDTKNVGENKILTPAGSVNDSNDGHNYTYNFVSVSTGSINPAPVTVTGITVKDKVYDGTDSATLVMGNASLKGVISPDIVDLVTTGASASFADANAGTDKAVTLHDLTVDNTNYVLVLPDLRATIFPVTPAINVTGGNFTYDGAAHPATATVTGIDGAVVPGSFAFKYNGVNTAPVSTGTYNVLAIFTSYDSDYSDATGNGSITVTAFYSGGGGGGGGGGGTPVIPAPTAVPAQPPEAVPTPAPTPTPSPPPTPDYLTVDFLGNIVKGEISSNGALLDQLVATGPNGSNQMVISRGTIALDKDGQIVKLLQITQTAMPPLSKDQVAVSQAYSFGPAGMTFSQPIKIFLGYIPDQVPQKIVSINLAYYNADKGWVDLQEGATLATSGQASGSVNHFTTFAVIARRAPATFQVSNLMIIPSKEKIWGAVPFIVIIGQKVELTAEVNNGGGMAGTYQGILKLSGQEAGQQALDLNPDQSGKLYFTLEGLSPGHHTVEIGGQSGEFTTTTLYNVFEMTGCFLLLGSIISGLVLFLKRRRRIKVE